MKKEEMKIVSGGQTGVDQGALDAAMSLGLAWGGWAPKGWLAENGTIGEKYRANMREGTSANYLVLNVAGPRESKAAGIQAKSAAFLADVYKTL